MNDKERLKMNQDENNSAELPCKCMPLDHQVVTEDRLMGILGVTKGQLDRLRGMQGLPYTTVGNRQRVYLTEDVRQWVVENRSGRVVANQ